MNRIVTIEIVNTAAMRFLRDLAAISFIRFSSESSLEEEDVTTQINKICAEEDTSLEPDLMIAQNEAIGREDW